MRYTIISDLHLTNKFDNTKLKAIKNIIEDTDQIIINGDFWDGYFIKFDQFYSSEWSKLFPLLKAKKCYYVFGNHDCEDKNNLNKIRTFCDGYGNQLDIEINKVKYHIEHGHRFFYTLDNIFTEIQQKVASLYYGLGTKILKEIFWKQYNYQNKKMYQKLTNIYPNFKFITSHSHFPININDTLYNTGMINYGLLQYIVINENQIDIIKARY